MKLLILFMCGILAFSFTMAQETKPDSMLYGTVSVSKDDRINLLGEKMLEYNMMLAKNIRASKGYRLMLMSTNDRDLAMQLRTRLLRQYPEHKVYMAYQAPFIKLKMGNFESREEAEDLKKQLLRQKLTPGNIYVVPETIELKPEKEEEEPE